MSTDLSAADVTHDDNFAAFLDSHVAVNVADLLTDSGAVRSRTHKAIDHLTLARQWGLAPDRALQTIDKTTQSGIRMCLYPSLSRRFSTNDCMLRYSRLSHDIFTDTMFSNIKSCTGKKCAQLFATNFGWVRVFPMESKGDDVHEALSLVFRRDGIPPAMIVDNSKEQLSRDFR